MSYECYRHCTSWKSKRQYLKSTITFSSLNNNILCCSEIKCGCMLSPNTQNEDIEAYSAWGLQDSRQIITAVLYRLSKKEDKTTFSLFSYELSQCSSVQVRARAYCPSRDSNSNYVQYFWYLWLPHESTMIRNLYPSVLACPTLNPHYQIFWVTSDTSCSLFFTVEWEPVATHVLLSMTLDRHTALTLL